MAWIRVALWIHLGLGVFCSFHVHRTVVDSQAFQHDSHYTGMSWRHDKVTYSCGDQLCWCRGIMANCSRVAGSLHYIPHLPREIRYLYFSYNHLTSISANFFQNATQLIKVDLSHNNLTVINREAFRPLQHLRYLFLSSNPELTYQSLSPVFSIPSLEELDIMSCSLGPLPGDLFHNATLPALKTLLLHANDVGNFPLSVFKPLPALKELGLATNSIITIHADCVLGVEKINLDTNFMYVFPDTCFGTSPIFPYLKTLLLQGNSLSRIPQQVCLPKLEAIALGKNVFSQILTGTFSPQKFPKLGTLSLYRMNTRISVIEQKAFSSPTLYAINLSYCHIKFSSKGIHEDSFAGCPHLSNLLLANNRMDVDAEKFVKLFGNLSTVRLVDMRDSELRILSPEMLSGFHNLNRLQLSRNRLLSLRDGLFDGLKHLQHLDLAQNQIRDVEPTVFSEGTRNRLLSVDLSGNPFSCSCDLLWFHGWLTSNASVFKQSWTTYACHNRPNMTVQRFHMAPQACIWRQTTYILVDAVVSLLIVLSVLISGLVRYRWHLRLLLYEAYQGHGEARQHHLQNNHFEYDVYVTYDIFDENWVQQHLIPELEGHLHLRLCLPEGDLDASRPELDTISNSVEKSKKMLMLFSNNFAQNQLCQFQLSMCLRHVLDHDDALVIACLDDVAPRDMTSAMIGVLKTTPYIQWAEEVDAVASFWGRLHIALQEVIQHRPH